MSGHITIRGHRGLGVGASDAYDSAIENLENWPHDFDEHPQRWYVTRDNETRQHDDYGGCRKCGASELSAIHILGKGERR